MTQDELKRFVKAWPVCTVTEVAAIFGISPREATVIANRLRGNGVPLRDQRRSRQASSVDYEALAALAREAAE